MAAWERQTHNPRGNLPSFSSSLLDAIYHSTDESISANVPKKSERFMHNRRNDHDGQIEEEIESMRRAIMIEKWMENYSRTNSTPRHFSSNSGSSTDSSFFSSSETESSASKSTPKSSVLPMQKLKVAQSHFTERPGKTLESLPKQEGRFTRTKSRALKIYGDLKKVKEPISPGGKISNFLNSIFSPRISKKNQVPEEWSSVRKSKSMKDTPTCALASRSCLSKTPSSRGNKSKRSVRFCPVSVVFDEDCGHKSIYDFDNHSMSASVPTVGSNFIKKNIDSFRLYEAAKMRRKHEFREMYENNIESDDDDDDDKSCASSDLFELDNIGRVGIGAYDEELPVYGTTSVRRNKAIASGLFI